MRAFLVALGVILVLLASLALADSAGIGGLSCYSPTFSGVCVIAASSLADAAPMVGGGWHSHVSTTRFGAPCGDNPSEPLEGGGTFSRRGFYAALPTRKALHKNIEVRSPKGTITMPVLDVGPLTSHDDAYVFGNGLVRPLAELKFPLRPDHPKSKAALDVSCDAAAALGIEGLGFADWRFV